MPNNSHSIEKANRTVIEPEYMRKFQTVFVGICCKLRMLGLIQSFGLIRAKFIKEYIQVTM